VTTPPLAARADSAHDPTTPGDRDAIRRSLSTPEAFAEVFDRHAPTVHRYLGRRLGGPEADDLVAETFLVAFERRRSYDLTVDDARPWLLGIATNLIRRHRRSETRLYRSLRRVAALTREHDDAATTERADAGLDAARSAPAVAAALADLSSRDRDVLLLHAWGELSYPEIAEALDIPVGTVRSRLFRARRQLRGHLTSLTTE
jgi:RNA polymerase sigma-70 factor (ECF subfamily)